MKSIAVMALIIAAIAGLVPGCTRAEQLPANPQPPTGEKKILIVYLSRTSNTRAIAEFIHQKVGGTLVALELERPYPADTPIDRCGGARVDTSAPPKHTRR